MECHVCNTAVLGGHKYKVCNKHVHLICGTLERKEIIAKSSRAQNVRKVKVSYYIIRHFFFRNRNNFETCS